MKVELLTTLEFLERFHGKVLRLAFSQSQPRVPAGSPQGGQWVSSKTVGEAASLVDVVNTDEGFTYDQTAGRLVTEGVPVGRPGHSIIVSEDAWSDRETAKAQVVRMLTTIRNDPQAGDAKVGAWHDRAHREITLDYVDVAPTVSKGIALGRARGEQAVYDLKSGRTYDTGGTGGRENIQAVT